MRNVSVKKNQEYTVDIIDLSYEAYGVAKIDGFTVFIENVLPGEVAKIRIERIEKRFGFGKLLELVSASPDRVEIKDIIGTRIGTMPLQHLSYEKQLEFKRKLVLDCFERVYPLDPAIVENTLGMASPWEYRNKAQIPVREVSGLLETGFFKRNSHDLVPIENYYIQEKEIDEAVRVVRDILRKHGIEAYNEADNSGIVRHVIVRRGHVTREMMIVLVVRSPEIEQIHKVVRDILDSLHNVVSIVMNVNEKVTNVIMGNQNFVLFGEDAYYDELLGKKYAISSKSFFQVNSIQTEVLYSKAIEYANITKDDIVIDAFCGIGTITLSASDMAKHVYGVEVVADAIKKAQFNAKLNSVDNVTFEVGKAEDVMKAWIKQGISADVMIVDPPRKGLAESFIQSTLEVKSKRIVYVSCNPVTLARDVKLLVEGGYSVEMVQPVDMFPHTVHTETCVLLSKIKSSESITVDIPLDELDLTQAESKATYPEIKEYVKKKYNLNVSSLYIAQVKRKHGIIEAENYNKGNDKTRQPKVTLEKQRAIEDAFNYFQMI